MRFPDSPVAANSVKAFECRFIPTRGAVELHLNEGRTAEDQEREAGVRKRRRHIVAELVQASLGPTTFARAWEEGRGMTREQAIAEAFTVLDRPATGTTG